MAGLSNSSCFPANVSGRRPTKQSFRGAGSRAGLRRYAIDVPSALRIYSLRSDAGTGVLTSWLISTYEDSPTVATVPAILQAILLQMSRGSVLRRH